MERGLILFVDDDVLSQWTHTEVLNQAGFKTISVCRAQEAERLLRRRPEIDLLLTDVTLPDDCSGVGVAELSRWLQPSRPVVYMTRVPRLSLGRLADGEAYIEKPCSGGALLTVIEEALDASRLYTVPQLPLRRGAWMH